MEHSSWRNGRSQAGFSLLELQVAFVVFGIALAGVGPLVVMQSKQVRKLEARFDHDTTYYLVPAANAWARKLGAQASILAVDPGSSTPLPGPAPVNDVRILSVDKLLTSDEVTAHVTVLVIP